jgi:hypothetical protein
MTFVTGSMTPKESADGRHGGASVNYSNGSQPKAESTHSCG